MVLPRVEEGIFGSIKSQTFKREECVLICFNVLSEDFFLSHWQLHFTRVGLNVFFPVDLSVFSLPLPKSHPEFQIQVDLKS